MWSSCPWNAGDIPAARRRRALLAGPVSLAAAVLLAGCSVGPQDRPDLVAPVTRPTPSASATLSSVPLTVQVFLLRGDRLVRVSRSVPAATGLTPSLTGLALPLTPEQVADGLRTAFPAGEPAPHGRLDGTVATVTMPTGFDHLSVREQVGAMSQLVYTVTADTTATEVELVSDGRTLQVPDGSGRLLSRPVNRSDYATWAPVS